MKFLIFFLLTFKILITFEQSISCRLCIDVINEVKKLIDEDEPDIISKMATICDKVTFKKQPFDSICRKYVVRKGDEIIKYIEKYEEPNIVCSKLHFC
uniref:Saposin B-type domain-containing protein n=1 Tax=Strongyloides papillosus TaxID=174720 RepID=A0A0N5CBK5_STREA